LGPRAQPVLAQPRLGRLRCRPLPLIFTVDL
jgi:hypothetical protein